MKLLEAIRLIESTTAANEAIFLLLEKGCPKSVLKLVIQDQYGLTNKDIEARVKRWEDQNPAAKARGAAGFAAEYYDWLAADQRSEAEAYGYIMDVNNSKNVHSHLTHYLNIWALAESVRQGKKVQRTIVGKAAPKQSANNESEPQPEPEAEPEVETPEDEQAKEIKAAWAVLRKFAVNLPKTKRGFNKVHPDKVSHLGNAELTKAYTEMYQKAPK